MIQKGCRCDLNDLLMPAALDGAIAFPEVDEVAVLVAEQLNFNVARLRNKFLNENVRASKGGERLCRVAACSKELANSFFFADDPHAATTPPLAAFSE